MHLCRGGDRNFLETPRCLISSHQQRCFYAHTTSEYVSEYVHIYLYMYIYIYTYTLPGTNIWDDTGNKNYNLCSRIPLLPYSSGPVVLRSCGPVVLWPPQTQAPQDFASFPVENLLIYQPSTARPLVWTLCTTTW